MDIRAALGGHRYDCKDTTLTDDPKKSLPSILVTGANGHLGTQLVRQLAATRPVIAAVRSATAAAHLTEQLAATQDAPDARAPIGNHPVRVEVIAYNDVPALTELLTNCVGIVHLVGIIKESSTSRYFDAHEATTQALLDALRQVGENQAGNAPRAPVHVCYPSIVGARPDADNACLASKGRAEQMLLDSEHPTTVLQLPMVLGEGDYAAMAINQQARRRLNFVFAKLARDQPIYAGDVLQAITKTIPATDTQPGPDTTPQPPSSSRLVLAGPEAVTKAQLIKRAAAIRGRNSTVVGLPLFLARAFTHIIARLSDNPPITPAMLEILHHDDDYDTAAATQQLGITLTSLDDTLAKTAQN